MPAKRESPEARRTRASTIVARLKKAFPKRSTALHHGSPLELLIATILSAQCTDERVNKVTVPLFKKYHTAKAFAGIPQAELEQEIRSTGFYRAKAKNIIQCCRALEERHHGIVPQTMEELILLAGVGRKTANVVLGNYFGIAVGIVVDTHVRRLSGRLGFTTNSDPEKIEEDLMSVLAKKHWIDFGNLLILHGRETCKARNPQCDGCILNDCCPSAGRV